MRRQQLLKLLLFFGLLFGLPATIEIGFRIAEPRRQAAHAAEPIRTGPKKPDELRVFVYGASTVFGVPVPAVGFVSQLRFWLERVYPGRPVNVVNYGRPGVNSSQIVPIVADTVGQGPDIVVAMIGHNEYLERQAPSGLGRTITRYSATVRRLGAWLTKPVVWPDKLVPMKRGPSFDGRQALYRENLGHIVDLAEAQRAAVILSTVGADLRDWAPAHQRLVRPEPGGAAVYEATAHRIEAQIAGGSLDEAQQGLALAFETYPGDAMLIYLRGRLRLARGDVAAARVDLAEAKDRDPFPWRVLGAINEITREVAKARGAHLVDVARLLDERAPGSAPGLELFADNCHPTPLGSAIIAGALTREIAAIAPSGADAAAVEASGGLDPFERSVPFTGGKLELAYDLANARYVMKTPFFNLPLARRYLERAAAIDAGSWEVLANLGTVSLLEGRVEQGKAELEKATALKGAPLDPADREKTPYLQEALRVSGLR